MCCVFSEDEESFEHTPYSTYQIQRLSSKPEAQVSLQPTS